MLVVPATAYSQRLVRADQARASSGSPESLHEADEDIRLFLSQFWADPHCKQVRLYQDEIELDNLQRKFERRAKGHAAPSSLLPIEQAYVEALSYARLDPERGMAKLHALIDLFDDGKKRPSSDPIGQCLKLAKRQLARLREQFDAPSGEQLDEALRRLDDADRLSVAKPAQAESIYRAVVELYGAQALGRRSGPPHRPLWIAWRRHPLPAAGQGSYDRPGCSQITRRHAIVPSPRGRGGA